MTSFSPDDYTPSPHEYSRTDIILSGETLPDIFHEALRLGVSHAAMFDPYMELSLVLAETHALAATEDGAAVGLRLQALLAYRNGRRDPRTVALVGEAIDTLPDVLSAESAPALRKAARLLLAYSQFVTHWPADRILSPREWEMLIPRFGSLFLTLATRAEALAGDRASAAPSGDDAAPSAETADAFDEPWDEDEIFPASQEERDCARRDAEQRAERERRLAATRRDPLAEAAPLSDAEAAAALRLLRRYFDDLRSFWSRGLGVAA